MESPTPYDGSGRPFAIGLKPLDRSAWIDTGADLLPMLEEKDRLLASLRPEIVVEEADTRAAQAELLELLATHLVEIEPGRYRRDGRDIVIDETRRVPLDGLDAPLVTASLMVADDLVLMRRGPDGWRLAAACLCFPSSWTLSEKFGKPLQHIHNPVPGFGEGTRTATIIERIFDNLPSGQPVLRWNWSLQSDQALYKPLSNLARDERAGAPIPRFAGGLAATFIRVERQTLMRLPDSGDIVFTIRIYLDPLDALVRHPECARLAEGLAEQLAGLDPPQLAYKGFVADRDDLVARLRELARA